MRLSELLERDILKISVGSILSRFKIKRRRNVLFFEDILAEYISDCEKLYSKEMKEIAFSWAFITSQELIPNTLKKLPLSILGNNIIKRIWKNFGIIDNFHLIKKNNTIIVNIENEYITRIIGENKFLIGFAEGSLSAVLNSKVSCKHVSQTKNYCKYIFKIEKKQTVDKIYSKGKALYNNLNYIPISRGYSLKDMLKSNILQLRKNKLYFRGKLLTLIENTLFHLLSNKKILLGKVSDISYKYFSKLIDKDSSNNRKMNLIKNLLEAMGWGHIKILMKKDNIIVSIKNPPYGLQTENDNWEFLFRVIYGYLRLINKKFKIKNISYEQKKVTMKCSL